MGQTHLLSAVAGKATAPIEVAVGLRRDYISRTDEFVKQTNGYLSTEFVVVVA